MTSLSWSLNGHTLASAATDAQLLLWDVLSGRVKQRVKLPSAAVRAIRSTPGYSGVDSHRRATVAQASVQLHPGGEQVALVCCAGEAAPHLVDFATTSSRASLGQALPVGTPPGEAPSASAAPSSRKGGLGGGAAASRGGCVAVFSTCGHFVFVGTAAGTVTRVRLDGNAAKSASASVQHCQRVCAVGVPVRHLMTLGGIGPASRELLVVTTGGRHVHVFNTEPRAESGVWDSVCACEDPGGKGTWACAALSSDAAWLCAALKGGDTNHIIHVWDVARGGKLQHVLEGPAESGAVTRLAWHPRSCVLLSLGAAAAGRVFVWAPQRAENWSAFAPDFRELEENEEYVEREDEFDVAPVGFGSDQPNGSAGRQQQELLATLDVLTMPMRDADELVDALYYLPLEPRMENPAQTAGDQHVGSMPASNGAALLQEEQPVGPEATGPQPPGKRLRR